MLIELCIGLYNKLPYRKLPDKLPGKLPSNLFINYPVIYPFFCFFSKIKCTWPKYFNKTYSVVYTTYFLIFKTKIFVCVCVVDVI